MIQLTCPKCSRQHPITDDEAVFFYPRFFCLSCGQKMEIPLKPDEYMRQTRVPDRDRRITGGNGQKK